ncbi:MAG: FtsX-like permease family protein [Acidimicrobiales bacterium]
MSAVWYRFRAELRTRWRAWLGLALLVGFATGAALAFAAGARRTDSAYARFLDAHRAYDVLVVNYAEDGTAVFDFDELERLPQVADSARTGFDYYTFDAGNLVSEDGRIGTEINRFKMLEGRPADPDEPAEIVVGFALAEEHDLDIGDTTELLPPEFIEFVRSPEIEVFEDPFTEQTFTREELADDIATAGRLLEEAPEGRVRIVGIEAAPGEFPPQFQLNRPLVHLTPALGRLFEFDPDHEALMVRLRGGSAAVDDFLAELERRSGGLPLQVQTQRDHAAAVQRSIHLQAVALWLLSGLTALAAALILGQLLARLTYVESVENPTLDAVGMGSRQRLVLGVVRAAAITAVGAVTGVAVALGASPFFPTGLARIAEPTPGFDADLFVLAAGATLTVAVVTLLGAWAAGRAARVGAQLAWQAADGRPSRLTRAVAGAGVPVAAAVGARMALQPGRGRGAVPVRTTVGAIALGMAALTAALTFGASLSQLLATPRLYGVTWDVELVTFEPCGLGREVVDFLRADERVAALAAGSASFGESIDIDGTLVEAIALGRVKGDITPPVLTGRAPAAPDEIVLGPRTLRALGVEVGDVVDVRVPGVTDPAAMRVVGTAVFPPVSESAQLGTGGLIVPEAVAALDPSEADDLPGVTLRFAPGVDPQAVLAGLEARLDYELFPIEPAQPGDIVSFGRVEAMPLVLGGILAAISAATLVHLLVSAVRRRRRDLAVLKTLGFVRRQVAGTVAWQATTVVVVGMLLGVPAGVIVGRWTWTLLAESLGVVARAEVPLLALAVAAAAAVVLANAIAIVPSQMAARTPAAADLGPE